MKTFLLVVAGVFVGGILFLVVLWFTIKLLIRWLLKKVAKFVEAIAGGNVPPFRITLDKTDDIKWSKAKQIKAVTKAFEKIGYEQIGDFRIPEILPLQLDGIRALMNPATATYAVLNGYPSMGVVVDIAWDFVDGEHLAVSNAPQTGLDRPDFSRLERIEVNLVKNPGAVAQLHEKAVELQAGRAAKPVSADAFATVFRKAHAREMDWRVERGGVTAEEVRRVAELQKQEPPTDEAVEMVRQHWRTAISLHVDQLLRERFEQYMTKTKSIAEWQEVRDRIYIVHEHSDVEQVIARLSLAVSPEEAAAGSDPNTVDGRLVSVSAEETANLEQTSNGDVDVAALFGDEANGEGAAGELLPVAAVAVAEEAIGEDDEIALDAEPLDSEDEDSDGEDDSELDEEDRARAAAEARVRAVFQGCDVRAAFVAAQELLVRSRRYRRLLGIKTPYKADVYVGPEGAEDY
jgi:hypothetical protein